MNIVLLKGHSSKDGGAEMAAGEYKGIGEYEMAGLYIEGVAERLREIGHTVTVTSREEAGGITPTYSAAAANATDAALAVEFHFNAAANLKATGTEVICWYRSSKGEAAALAAQETLVDWLGNKDRGIVYSAPDKASVAALERRGKRGDIRGYNYFVKTRAVALMFEPDFSGSNPDAAIKFGEAVKSGVYADACADAVNAAAEAIEQLEAAERGEKEDGLPQA